MYKRNITPRVICLADGKRLPQFLVFAETGEILFSLLEPYQP